MAQLQNIEAIERRLWSAADQLRANSNLASNEYFMPVMGLIFLRHAYSRYLAVKPDIEKALPSRGGVTRPLTKEDFSERSAIFLRPEAQFDYLVANANNAKLSDLVVAAMESIERDYKGLEGVLPKQEYQELDYAVLGNLLRTLNPDELKRADGDIFGRIYEYFLTQFADQGAHDGGEFFTPISIVSFIANVLEPRHGIVADPACGSGGMFVQSAHIVERYHENPAERLTFKGYEKNKTTANLAKMNLAVHGLEGAISSGNDANSYYNDPQNLLHACDFVMANPPFNVDEVDAEKVKNDPRLPFGLSGVNKAGKVSNANYLWIQYFYSYLNDTGRAGFVMSSQASNAGRDEAKVRQRLTESGHVDIMVAIRPNFFYTRSVPCELWFLNKAKSPEHRDTVLMLDARSIFRQVTRKIYDFSPEQLQNLLAVVWLYRGEQDRFLDLMQGYFRQTLSEGQSLDTPGPAKAARPPFTHLLASLARLQELFKPWACIEAKESEAGVAFAEFVKACEALATGFTELEAALAELKVSDQREAITALHATGHAFEPVVTQARELIVVIERAFKYVASVGELLASSESGNGSAKSTLKEVQKERKVADETRQMCVERLKEFRYFYRQAEWLLHRFPEGTYCDVEGLVKLVSLKEIEQNAWSLSPGRYVGVASVDEDDEFDFEETMRELHAELQSLNDEAVELAALIQKNVEALIG